MFNLSFSELIIVAVIALIFIGPKELPDIARVIGRFLNELKRTSGELTSTLMEPRERLRQEMDEIAKSVQQSLEPHEGDRLDHLDGHSHEGEPKPETTAATPEANQKKSDEGSSGGKV